MLGRAWSFPLQINYIKTNPHVNYIVYHYSKDSVSAVSHALNSHGVPSEQMYRIRISEKYFL